MAEQRPKALLRQERSRATREALVRTAERLWRSQGFDETTVSEICEAAGVAKGTFYFHFPRKEDLLIELGLLTAGRAADDWTLVDEDVSVLTALERVLTRIGRRVERNPKPLVQRTILELYGSMERIGGIRGERSDFGSLFGSIFARGQERGEVTTEYPASELGGLLSALMLQDMLVWSLGRVRGVGLPDLLLRHSRIFVCGMLTGQPATRV